MTDFSPASAPTPPGTPPVLGYQPRSARQRDAAAAAEPRWLRPLVVAGALVIFVSLAWSNYYRVALSAKDRSDFSVCHAAGRAVLAGTDIYEAHNRRGWYFMYLPAFAVLMVPLAMLPVGAASLAWYLLSVAMLVHGLVLCVRLARDALPRAAGAAGALPPTFWLATFAGAATLWPTWSGLLRGQVSWLIAYLVILAVYLAHGRRAFAAGACLAGAVVIKIFPALLLVYFAYRGRWRPAAWTLAWLVVLVLAVPSAAFGARGNLDLLAQWVTRIAIPANNPQAARNSERYIQMVNPHLPRNQSLQAVLIRAATRRKAPDAPRIERVVKFWANAAGAGLALASVWACGWRRTNPRGLPYEAAVVVVLCLLLAPVSWVHNYVLMSLPVAVALAAVYAGGDPARRRAFGWALGAYVLANVLSASIDLVNEAGALMMATLLLWGVFAWDARRARLAEDADDPRRAGGPPPHESSPAAAPA